MVDCGRLENPDNGVVTATGSTYQSQATFSCAVGYECGPGNCDVSIDCQADGSWSENPKTYVFSCLFTTFFIITCFDLHFYWPGYPQAHLYPINKNVLKMFCQCQ